MRYLMMYRMIKDHVEHHLELPYHYPMYVGTIHPNLCVGIKQTNQKPLIHVPGKKVKFIFHNGDGIHCCCLLRIACRYFYMRYLHLSTFRGSDKCLRARVTANENKPELDCVIWYTVQVLAAAIVEHTNPSSSCEASIFPRVFKREEQSVQWRVPWWYEIRSKIGDLCE